MTRSQAPAPAAAAVVVVAGGSVVVVSGGCVVAAVVVGGVICCGQPTHVGYVQQHAPKKRKKVHKPRPAPAYVAYGKGYDDGVVYEKGQ